MEEVFLKPNGVSHENGSAHPFHMKIAWGKYDIIEIIAKYILVAGNCDMILFLGWGFWHCSLWDSDITPYGNLTWSDSLDGDSGMILFLGWGFRHSLDGNSDMVLFLGCGFWHDIVPWMGDSDMILFLGWGILTLPLGWNSDMFKVIWHNILKKNGCKEMFPY